ncbi:MAG: hypothetical protein JOZ58_28165, partial [Acetobacteraceae bacterium]|nr:hypothetical protein [Acetobacteraceae bacterium]
MPWQPPPLPSCFAQLFALILKGLQKAMAANGPKAGAYQVLVNPTWNRISRLSARFLALVAAFREGRLRPPRSRTRRSSRKDGSPKPFRFPSKFGWLLRFGSEVACSRSQLEYWLNTNADAAAFIAAVPQSGRIIRPLCHMLGIELPEAVRLPPRPRRQRARQRQRNGAITEPAEGAAPAARSPA